MNVAIIYKHKDDSARALAETLGAHVRQQGATPCCEAGSDLQCVDSLPGEELIRECSLCVVLGGDGTFLHAASLMKKRSIPILGINMGSLGFLTPFSSREARSALDLAMAGTLKQSTRFRFDARRWRGDNIINQYRAANDVVISHTDLARLLELECWDNSDHMASYKADGLILATPMGSTAYALAAGGPILSPDMEALALVPICPHQLTQRPIVIPSSSEISIRTNSTCFVTIDGQRGCTMDDGDRLVVSRSDLPLTILLPPNYSIFNVLRHKLSWGAREALDA